MAKISVIVPVYKVEPYLSRCVDSILGNTFRDFELILVDDGSPDRCGEICDEYAKKDSRVHVIHQENGGLSAARNTGIELVLEQRKSKYISFVDSDDVVAPDYFECLLAGMNDSVDVSCVRPLIASEFTEDSFVMASTEWRNIDTEEYWCDFGRYPMSAWGKLYRIALFAEMRYPVGKIHEDEFLTHLLLFAKPTIAFLDVQKYGYRKRGGSITDEWTEKNLVRVGALKQQIEYFHEHGFFRAEEKTAKRLCSEDFVRAIRMFGDDLRNEVKKYDFISLDFYSIIYPKTYPIRWCFAYTRKHGLLSFVQVLVRKFVNTLRFG